MLYLQRLTPEVESFGAQLLRRSLTLEYRRGWPADTDLIDAIMASELRDRQTGSTELGPHRAELVLRLDERRVQDEASRGQQKLTAAALILAQVAVETRGRPMRSVLVVDDPAAELDGDSLHRLRAALTDLPAQMVFTALSAAQLVPAPDHAVFHVEHGEVRAGYNAASASRDRWG
jgi:DNA replication and repair protein RecF